MKSLPLTAVILTKNEQGHIVDCLQSLSWCSQVLIIDDYSTDQTTSLAKKFKQVKIIQHHLKNNFAAQRNYALSQVKTNWVLFIDADERISSSLAQEIQSAVIQSSTHRHSEPRPGGAKNPHQDQQPSPSFYTKNPSGFYLRRQDHLWGKILKHGETAHVKLLRLARKKAGRWQGQVHETWQISGATSTLHYPLDHYPHPALSEFLTQINYYSTLRARELHQQHTFVCILCVISYPLAKFFFNYFWLLGILDGPQGFAHALLMSFHSFLVRAKLYLLNHRTRSPSSRANPPQAE